MKNVTSSSGPVTNLSRVDVQGCYAVSRDLRSSSHIVHLGCVEPISSSYHTECYQKWADHLQQTDRIHDKRRSRTGRSSKVQKGRTFHTRERRVLGKCELRGAREVGNIDSCCTLEKTR